MKCKFFLLLMMFWTATGNVAFAQQANSAVKIIGEMRNVMWKGQLYGTINLDTISNKQHLFGMGPVAYLAGEVLVIDGKSYKSTVVSNTEMRVEETFKIEAPFFASANIPAWKEQPLPDSVQTLQQLEQYLDAHTKTAPRPFMFRLSGTVEQAKIHIVNLPKGAQVSSPDEAHKGQVNYALNNESADMVGFFSTQHKAIFTHHDTFLHLHLITTDRKKMGHIDEVLFKKGTIKLYLPAE